MKKRLFIFLASIFIFTLKIFCDTPTISLEFSDVHYLKNQPKIPTVFTGDSFQLKAVISGTEHATNDIKINGLENFSVNNVSTQSSVSIINSKVNAEKSTTYNLLPIKHGSFQIGPAQITYNGKTITSNNLKINVIEQDSLNKVKVIKSKNDTSPQSSYRLFCKLTASKNEAFLGEPIIVKLLIYSHGQIIGIDGIKPPDFLGFETKEIKNINQSKKNINKKTFTVHEKQFVLFPTEQGLKTINPAQVVYKVKNQHNLKKAFSFFDDDFFPMIRNIGIEQKIAASNTLTINVQALPNYQKQIDGVGEFEQFESTIDKKEVLLNEPILFTLKIQGNGNLDQIVTPKLLLPKSFKFYESKIETTENLNSEYVGGTKKFEFIIQIPKIGQWEIPSQKFTYFDTNLKLYKTLETKPIIINVTFSEEQSNQNLNQSTNLEKNTEEKLKTNVEPIKDIHFIEEEAPTTQKDFPIFSLLTFIFLLMIPPFMFYLKKIKHKLLPVYKKLFKFNKNNLPTYQKQLKFIINNNKPEKLYLFFISFLSQIFDISVEKVSEELIESKLQKKGLNQNKTADFLNYLNTCARFTFASEKVSADELEHIQQKGYYWLLTINQIFKNNKG